jgi:hypothetical protein
MTTATLEHEQVTRPLEDVFPIALHDGTGFAKAKEGRKEQSVTVALGFLIGCVTLMMTGFSVIIVGGEADPSMSAITKWLGG